MANSLSVLMTKILAGALTVLTEEFTALKVAQTDLSGEAAQKGDTISMSPSIAQTASAVTPASTVPAIADLTPTEVTVQLSNHRHSRFHLSTLDIANIQKRSAQGFIAGQIAESARALMYEANASLFGLYKYVYGYAGTAGTSPFATNLNPLVDGRQVVNTQLCPEGNRHMILGYTAESDALKLTAFNQALYRGSADTLNKGELGDIMGFKAWRDGQVPTHTSTPLTAGAATVNGVHAVGVSSISIAKLTNTSPLVVGDILVFGSQTQTYVVTAAATLAVGNTAVAISPPLKVALAGGEAVVLKATHVSNLLVDPGWAGFAARVTDAEIEGVPTIGIHQVMRDEKTGLALKLSALPGFECAQWMLSWVYGVGILDPRRAARLAG